MGQEESSLVATGPPKTLKDRSLSAVAEYITSGRAKRIVVLTGAGISTAAGIPDFRSPKTGLYNNLKRLNLPYAEAVFDISFFRENPEPFYVLANELYPGKFHPTVSHVFIALLARKGLLQMLFTQNIDCLERAAGVPSDKIIEAHGSFATQRCVDCKNEYPDDKMKEHVFRAKVPRCEDRECHGLVKPDIVFFGEPLPKTFDHNTYQAAMADLVLIVGTSLSVYPFAGLPELASEGKPRVLFNMERVGHLGNRTDDVMELGSCDAGIRKLADELGWRDELEELWRSVVGDEEAERQLGSQEEARERLEEEVEKLTAEVEAVMLKDAKDDDSDVEKKTDGDIPEVAQGGKAAVISAESAAPVAAQDAGPETREDKGGDTPTVKAPSSPPALPPTDANDDATKKDEELKPGASGKATAQTRGANQTPEQDAN